MKRKDLPIKILEQKEKLFRFAKIKSISILKEKNNLILAVRDTIQSYDLQENTLKVIQSHEFNECQLNACVNNKDKEIIILKNNVFSKYNFDFVKISEDKILELDDNLIYNIILVFYHFSSIT